MNFYYRDMADGMTDERELNNSLYWLLRIAFYGSCIGEILKAIFGGCAVGAFTLSLCAVSALAELEWCNQNQQSIDEKGKPQVSKNNRDLFMEWINKWLKNRRTCLSYDAKALYAVRCALVHSYGWAEQLIKAEIDGYTLLRRDSAKHCIMLPSKEGGLVYNLNLEDLITDLIFAVDDCMWHLQPQIDERFMNYVRRLIVPKKWDFEGNILVNTELISLDFFDKRLSEYRLRIDSREVLERIVALYGRKNLAG